MKVDAQKTDRSHYDNEGIKGKYIGAWIIDKATSKEYTSKGTLYKAKAKEGFLLYEISEDGKQSRITYEYEGGDAFKRRLNDFEMKFIERDNGPDEIQIGDGKTGFILRENGGIESNSNLFSLPGGEKVMQRGQSGTLLQAFEKAIAYARTFDYRPNRDFPADTYLYTTLNAFRELTAETIGVDLETILADLYDIENYQTEAKRLETTKEELLKQGKLGSQGKDFFEKNTDIGEK